MPYLSVIKAFKNTSYRPIYAEITIGHEHLKSFTLEINSLIQINYEVVITCRKLLKVVV